MQTLSRSLRIIVSGRVQGVGFRPFISRLAHTHGLFGWVLNCGGEVEIRVEGPPANLAAFQAAMTAQAPPLAQPTPPRIQAVEFVGFTDFTIRHSEALGEADIHIPPDYFVCADCLAELQDPRERRFRYPFINCTQCGPRYTLIDRLPYDRPNTAMAGFSLCPDCRAEYENPLDRRFHAQPLACEVCGPRLSYRQPGQADIVDNEAALSAAVDALRRGLTIAVKGVGGYHLLCDATDEQAVIRLRRTKNRPAKPLAVLLPTRGIAGLDWVEAVANTEPSELEKLLSPLRPIVLMAKREDSPLAGSIAPDLNEVGLMLPYSPLHHLLTEAFALPLVATSANISGEPVLTEEEEVERRLGMVAAGFLHHDRPIRRPADDSVFRRIANRCRPLRLGRGLAPVERNLPFTFAQPVLAVGADLKNTVALGFGQRLVISPHIGDLSNRRSGEVFQQVIADLQQLYGISPQAVVCDAHPNYHSSRWAKALGLPVHKIFHHHAHASALAGEHQLLSEDSIVFTWDGVGFGEDQSLWGGETLLGRPGAWRRRASLRPFRLLGGDRANREPWRCALALCMEIGKTWDDCPGDVDWLRHAWQRKINCPASTSVGRLFDAAAALLGLGSKCSYEGQAAMRLEALSQTAEAAFGLPLRADADGCWRADWAPLLPLLMNDSLDIVERGSLFHACLARLIVDVAVALRLEQGINKVGLTGGVFQNRLLTGQAEALLASKGFEVFLALDIPTNDACISLGQLIEYARS